MLLVLHVYGCSSKSPISSLIEVSSRTKKLISPVVFETPKHISEESTVKAIKETFIKRRWIPYNKKTGMISS